MKIIILLAVFCWSSMALATNQKIHRTYGHWPIMYFNNIDMIMPSKNIKIATKNYKIDKERVELDPQLELLFAGATAAISLTPHMLIGYY